jgi:hypothetical protein
MIGAALKPLVDGLNLALGAAAKLPGPIRALGAGAAAAGITVLGLAVAINAVNASLVLFGGASGVKAAIAGLLSFQGVAALATKAAVALNLAVLGPWALVAAGLAAATAAAYKFNQPFKEFVDTIPQRFNAFWRSIRSDAEVASGRMRVAFDAAAKFIASGIRQMAADQRELQGESRRTAQVLSDSMKWAADSMGVNFSSAFDFIQERWKGVVANMINFSTPLLTILKGIGIDVGAAAMQAMTTDQQRLVAAGSQTMYTSIGPNGETIVYDATTGRPISNPAPFVPRPATVPGATSATALPAPGTTGSGTSGRGRAAEVKKTVQELLGLTPAEFTAAVNTAIGEYGGLDPRGRTDVFANILARSRSPQYPSNLVDVVTQPGQYAPNFGRSRAQVTNPNLYGRAQFEKVKAELMDAQMLAQSIQDVDSRLYFKGISQQRNMVRGVDFLRAPDQNFFHGPGRSDPGRNPQITAQLLSQLGDTGAVTGYLDRQTQAAEQFREQQRRLIDQITEGNQSLQERTREIDRQAELARAISDTERRTLEYYFQQEDIQEKFDKLRDEALEQHKEAQKLGVEFNLQDKLRLIGEQEKRELQLAEYSTAKELLDLRYAENDVLADRIRMMQQLTAQAAEAPAFQTQGMRIEAQIATLKDDLAEMTSIATVAGRSAEAIGGAFGNAFRDLISGAASARQVLAGFFQDVAQGFAQMAAEIIAKQMAMIALQTILKALGAVAGGGSTFAAGGQGGISPALGFDPGGFAAGDTGIPFFGRALGGGVSAGRPYPVGENGPELFVPYQAGTIIPAEATEALQAINNASMRGLQVPFQGGSSSSSTTSRSSSSSSTTLREVPFQRGMEGLAVPFQRGGDAGGGMGGGAGSIDVKFETVRIGELDFVTKDEAQRIGRESAKQGAALAQKRITNNPTARRQAGLP